MQMIKTEDPTIDYAAENNLVLGELLKIATHSLPLRELFEQSLDALLTLRWLSLLPEAGVFLTEKNRQGEDVLNLVAERNLDTRIKSLCATVKFGQCLCGRAAQSKKIIYASHIDHRHEINFDGIAPHGHYNFPILSGEKVLGVIVFYLPEGQQQNDDEITFLSHAAGVFALMIELHHKQYQLEHVNRELSYQKYGLDEHAVVSIANIKGEITYANDKFCKMSGYSQDELLGKNHRIVKSGYHKKDFYKDLWRTIARGNIWNGDIKNRTKDGNFYWVHATIVPFLNEKGKPYQYVAIRTDITKQKNTEEAFARAQSVANIGNWTLDRINDHLTWSDQIYDIFGLSKETFKPSFHAFVGALHPNDLNRVVLQFQKSIDQNFPYDIEHRIIRRDNGEIRWLHEKCVHHENKDGIVIRSDGIVQDITERKKAEKTLLDVKHRFHLATEAAEIGIWELNLKTNKLRWDKQMFQLYGLPPSADGFVDYQTWRGAVVPEELHNQEVILQETIRNLGRSTREFRINRYDDNEVRIIHAVESVRMDEEGNAAWMIGTNRDITKRKLAEQEILRLAMTDPLTGLANRNQFYRRFSESAKLAKREGKLLYLMLLDLDNFKPVNDTYGHQVGDALLKEIASIFRKNCRETDVVARFGGDEFAILLVHPESTECVEICAQRIIKAVNIPLKIAGNEIRVGVSIGISIFPQHSSILNALSQHADMALYESKRRGRNTFCVYKPGLSST